MKRRHQGRLPRGAYRIVLTGYVSLPPSIFPWERDLIVPVLASLSEAKKPAGDAKKGDVHHEKE